MADSSQNGLFSLLAARYGIGPALQLFGLISGQGSDFSKAIGATQLAKTGTQGLGYLLGNKGLSSLGGYAPYVSPGIAGAGLGYNLYNIANNPNLSTGQKIGQSSVNAATSLAALYGPQAPYVAAFIAAQAIGGKMQRSGSPQVRAGGRQILAPLLPVSGFLDVLSGSKSPKESFNNMITQMGQVPVIGKPLGGMLRAFGLGTKPTTGTMFRRELSDILGQFPATKGTDVTKYNMPVGGYGSFSPQSVTAAQQLGQILAAFAPSGRKNADAYALQAENVLLNRYGNTMPDILKQLLPLLRGEQPTGTQPPGAQTAAQAPGGLGMGAQTAARVPIGVGTYPLGGGLPDMIKTWLATQKAA